MTDFHVDILRNNIAVGRMKVTSVSIKYDADAEVMRGMRCVVLSLPEMQNGFTFNRFSDRLRPMLNGQSLGVFMIIASPETLAETGSYWTLEAYDETMLFKQAALKDRAYYAAGTSYMSVIQGLITSCGITNIFADSNVVTLPEAREFEPGTKYLEIINMLLTEINFDPVHQDADGVMRLSAKQSKSYADFVYKDKNQFKLIGAVTRDTDIYNRPNVLVGVVSNPDSSPMTYTATNSDPMSALSTVNRGYEVVKVYNLDSMADLATLQAYIDSEKLAAMQISETVDFQTLAEIGHEYRSTVQLSTDLVSGLYVEKEWQLDMTVSSARMRHKAERKMYV